MGVASGVLPFGLSNDEACRAFDWILRNPRPQWIVTPREIGLAQRQAARPLIHPMSRSQESLNSSAPSSEARNAREVAIGHIWSELLGIAEPDRNADFFESGGDSLLAVQLGARLESQFETPVTLEQILRAPTIAALARQIGV